MQQYIKTDPVIKGVSAGMATAAIVTTAIESVPLVVNGVQQLNNGAQIGTLLMNNTTVGQVATGVVAGIAGVKTNAPPDVTLPTVTQNNVMNLITVIDYFSKGGTTNNQQQTQQQQTQQQTQQQQQAQKQQAQQEQKKKDQQQQ